MKEIESDQALWQTKQRKRAEKAQKQEQAAKEPVKEDIDAVSSEIKTSRRPGFY